VIIEFENMLSLEKGLVFQDCLLINTNWVQSRIHNCKAKEFHYTLSLFGL